MESVQSDFVLFTGSHTSANWVTKIKETTDSYALSDKILLDVSDNAGNIVPSWRNKQETVVSVHNTKKNNTKSSFVYKKLNTTICRWQVSKDSLSYYDKSGLTENYKVNKHYYCKKCTYYLGYFSQNCPVCNSSIQSPGIFIKHPLDISLKNLF